MDMASVNRGVIERFRAGGDIPGMHRDRLLLLTTTGARSGERRTAPMMFVPDGDRLLVIASNNGAASHPSWYTNLVANPSVGVEVGDEAFEATARPLEGTERETAWRSVTAQFPFFLDHEAQAGRTIPVVALTRTGSAPS